MIAVDNVELDGWPLPGGVPSLITDLLVSMDDHFLYRSNWLHMQLSGAHGGGRRTGALLLPVEAVVVASPRGHSLGTRLDRLRKASRRPLRPDGSGRVGPDLRSSCESSNAGAGPPKIARRLLPRSEGERSAVHAVALK